MPGTMMNEDRRDDIRTDLRLARGRGDGTDDSEPAYHEVAELTRAFMAISDPEQRASVLILARALAKADRLRG